MEFLYVKGCFECEGYSPQFKIVPQACEPPTYDMIITTNDDGDIESARFEEIKDE